MEEVRGLSFVQRPTVEIVDSRDSRVATLAAEAAAREVLRPTATPGTHAPIAASGNCFPQLAASRVLCIGPAAPAELRLALALVLDAQHYPRLAASAPRLAGDPGVAARAVLATRARLTSAMEPVPAADANWPGVFAKAEIPLGEGAQTPSDLVSVGTALFLGSQRDREAPFRTPPASTKQILSPPHYRAGERPLLLTGAPPEVPGCRAAIDESVGIARLLGATAPRGGNVPSAALAGWRGDRGIHYACDDESRAAPWIFVAAFDDEAGASAFAASADRLLGAEFATPSEGKRIGSRFVRWRGIERGSALDWAAALAAEPFDPR
jgi:hypothetical protein